MYILHFNHPLILLFISGFVFTSSQETTVTQSGVDEPTINESSDNTGKMCLKLMVWKCFNGLELLVFSTTFNNISAISWSDVLLVEETRVPRENTQPVTSHWQILSHNVVSSNPNNTCKMCLKLIVWKWFNGLGG